MILQELGRRDNLLPPRPPLPVPDQTWLIDNVYRNAAQVKVSSISGRPGLDVIGYDSKTRVIWQVSGVKAVERIR